jgi:hypothetical protein
LFWYILHTSTKLASDSITIQMDISTIAGHMAIVKLWMWFSLWYTYIYFLMLNMLSKIDIQQITKAVLKNKKEWRKKIEVKKKVGDVLTKSYQAGRIAGCAFGASKQENNYFLRAFQSQPVMQLYGLISKVFHLEALHTTWTYLIIFCIVVLNLSEHIYYVRVRDQCVWLFAGR